MLFENIYLKSITLSLEKIERKSIQFLGNIGDLGSSENLG